MQYTHQFLRRAFINGGFFGKGVLSFPECGRMMSLISVDDVYLAVKKAYSDMQPRTFRRLRDIDTDLWRDLRNRLLMTLAGELVEFFRQEFIAAIFDGWHRSVCIKLMADFNEALLQVGYAPICFGKIQKLVNMSFKYLYCFDSALDHSEHFSQAHMALDTYTLNWYKKMVVDEKLPVWSNLSAEVYYRIQNNIRVYLTNNPVEGTNTVFEAEFIVWNAWYQ